MLRLSDTVFLQFIEFAEPDKHAASGMNKASLSQSDSGHHAVILPANRNGSYEPFHQLG